MPRSEKFNNIIAAIHALRAEVVPAKKDSFNTFHKSSYADLESVHNAIQPALTIHGLTVIQSPSYLEAPWESSTTDKEGLTVTRSGKLTPTIETTIYHSSGEWISSVMPLFLTKADPQSQGSAITYGRRYALTSMLDLIQADDDGHAASQPDRPKVQQSRPLQLQQKQSLRQPPQPRKEIGITVGHIMSKALAAGWKTEAAKEYLSNFFEMDFAKITTLEPKILEEGLNKILLNAPNNIGKLAPIQREYDSDADIDGRPDDYADGR